MRVLALFAALGAVACATGVAADGKDDEPSGTGGTTSTITGGSSTTSSSGQGGAAGGVTSSTGGGGTSSGGGSTSSTSSSSSGMGGHPVWINEIHYDNTSTDSGEGIELAGLAGLDLSQYQLELHTGGGPALYDTIDLSGSIPNQQNGYGATWFALPSNGLQNGPNDGVALVAKTTKEVVQFLGYEGTMTANDGAANSMTSSDIGVAEQSSTPVGQSLQLSGTGKAYTSFSWTGPVAASPGQPNSGQSFQ